MPGGQSFCLGGYYSECRLDTASGLWKIVEGWAGQEDGEGDGEEQVTSLLPPEEGGSQPVAGGGQQVVSSPALSRKRTGKAMKKACACQACRSVSSWLPGLLQPGKLANAV